MKIKIGQNELKYPNLKIECGVTLCTGASGSGKTTLLKALHGILCNDSCAALVQGRTTSLMPQQEVWIPYLSLKEQLLLFGGKQAIYLAQRLKISTHLSKYPEELSIGQLQRLSLALTLSKRGKLVLLDEPTSALDDDIAVVVFQLIEEYVSINKGVSIVAVTHDVRMKNHFCNAKLWDL
ncbi:MAG: ATP-binding cassette domain-containing protein [Bacteroidota bacterium]|nr:ATP-binding cassette domain-containing protein [Bacteroidota bacterium]